jgi:hypothetical protein
MHLRKVVISGMLLVACQHTTPSHDAAEVKVIERSRKVKPDWAQIDQFALQLKDQGDNLTYVFIADKVLSLKGQLLDSREKAAEDQLRRLVRETIWTSLVAGRPVSPVSEQNAAVELPLYREFHDHFRALNVSIADIYIERVEDSDLAEGSPMAGYYKAFILVTCSKHQVLGIMGRLAAHWQKSGYASARQLGIALGTLKIHDLRFAEVKP